jgi:uncharacterized membrane protein HdeD (DUF308 family)
MKSKKNWLMLKGILLLLITIFILTEPNAGSTRLFIRYAMLGFFIITYIDDIINYRKKNG